VTASFLFTGGSATQATDFFADGVTATNLSSASLTGQANSAKFLFATAYRRTLTNDTLLAWRDGSTDGFIRPSAVSSGNVQLNVLDAGGNAFVETMSCIVPLDDWCFLLMAINTNGTSRFAHWGGGLGNFSSGVMSSIPTDGRLLDFTPSVGWNVGKLVDSVGAGWRGALAEYYVALDHNLDITDSAVLEKFVKSDGTIVRHGGNGSVVTGTQPLIYLSGGGTAFTNNRGSGGTLTPTGTFTAYTDPVRIDL
jgi:hypothetical protein